jgi:regulator of sigma E protease
MILTLLIFLLVLLILVVSHEAGHFFSAKAFGIRVDEFGFGLPPRLFGIKKGETLYSFNLLPFGGFVKILGEEDGESSDLRNFGGRSPIVRTTVLLAGILANIFLAYLALTVVSAYGMYQSADNDIKTPGQEIMIVEVASNSPASEAGLEPGDKVEKIIANGSEFSPESVSQIQASIKNNAGKTIDLKIKRGGGLIDKSLMPRVNPPEGEGPVGIALSLIELKQTPWYLAPIDGAKMTWNLFRSTIAGFGQILSTLFGGNKNAHIEVSGPVGIYKITSSVINLGFGSFLLFIAALSINLAIINVLPIPGLDGGRFLFVLIEVIRRKKISTEASSLIHGIGLALLIILMLVITYHDLAKLF